MKYTAHIQDWCHDWKLGWVDMELLIQDFYDMQNEFKLSKEEIKQEAVANGWWVKSMDVIFEE